MTSALDIVLLFIQQLSGQLGDHTRITDPLARMNMQSSAMRSGLFMRNLGSLLLELGRVTMTLRMGQSPVSLTNGLCFSSL